MLLKRKRYDINKIALIEPFLTELSLAASHEFKALSARALVT